MTDKDDAAARKARAEALRQRIDQLKKPAKPAVPAPGAPATPPSPPPESPADFVHRRMRELDQGGKK